MEAEVQIELSSPAMVTVRLHSEGHTVNVTPRQICPGDTYNLKLSNVTVLQEAVYKENLQYLREENACLKSQLSVLQGELESVKTRLRGS